MQLYKTWTTPAGEVYDLYVDMLHQSHVLIAGATGSGKSVVINGIIATALYSSPVKAQFILVDPKRVELAEYAHLPHTIAHAAGFNPGEWRRVLQGAVALMDRRYMDMERRRLRMYDGSDIYVIIDEWANVYKNGGADCFKAVMRLVSEGRAARVHVIMATQVPTTQVIPSTIRENFPARICLRVNSKSQSRVLMDAAGCEALPWYGQGYYVTPTGTRRYNIPMIDDAERRTLIDYWTRQRPRTHYKLFK